MDLDIYQDGGALKTRLRASMVAGDAKCVQTPILYPNRRTKNVFLFFNRYTASFFKKNIRYPEVGDIVHVNYTLLDGGDQVQSPNLYVHPYRFLFSTFFASSFCCQDDNQYKFIYISLLSTVSLNMRCRMFWTLPSITANV